MNKNSLAHPIRGARDLYPQELAIRNWIFNKWRSVAKSFGYEEIDGPILESFDLFAAKSGEELVNQQMYPLEDRDGKKLGVRPELTPTYSRMIANKQGELTFPLRWTMFGNVWRYEKPQSGRSRDFWQWEVNIIDGDETMADAEILVLMVRALQSLGITSEEVVIRVNDRKYIQQKLSELGVDNQLYPKVLKIIDRKEKISSDEFTNSLIELKLSGNQVLRINELLSSTDVSSSEDLTALFNALGTYGVKNYFKFDPTIVRGLNYYTGTVFECFAKVGELKRSIFGGGRFNDLIETFGGGKVGAVGFAISDVVIMELLKQLNKLPILSSLPTQVLVTIFSSQFSDKSIDLCTKLRNQGVNTEIYPDPEAKLEKQLKYANKKGIPFVAILGENEVETQSITLKNMIDGKQTSLKIDELKDIAAYVQEPPLV